MIERRRLGLSFCGQGLIGGVTVYELRSSDLDLMVEMCSWWSVEEMVENGNVTAAMRRIAGIFP